MAEISFAAQIVTVENACRMFAVERGKTQLQKEFATGLDYICIAYL